MPKRNKSATLFASFAAVTLIIVAPQQGAAAPRFLALEKLESQGAKVSALAINLRDGSSIASLNAGDRLSPASLTKTVIAAAALEKWGSEHSFVTRVYMTGRRQGGVLFGDLIILGAGDPYLTNEKLWFLATDVARLGIREVKGNLVLNTSLFGNIQKDANRRAGSAFSRNAYNSPLSAVAVNFSVLALVAGASDKPGEPAYLGLEPYALPNVRVQGQVRSEVGGKGKLNVSRSKVGESDVLVSSGSAAIGEAPLRTYRSVSDADSYAAQVIRAFLSHAGVKVQGKERIEHEPLRRDAKLLTEVEGFPLDWQLRGLFKVSNNFIGDMLTILLDSERGRGATLEGGASYLKDYISTLSERHGIQKSKGNMVVDSGSGLTPENRLSAADFVALFTAMYKNAREFPTFLAALPIPGSEGTVKKRFSEPGERHLQTRMRAKTGTLTEPVDAVALGGYCRLSNGDWAAFATIVNGTSNKPHFGVSNIHDSVDKDLASIFPPESLVDGSKN